MRKRLTINELADIWPFSRQKVYQMAKNPGFPAAKVGGKWLIDAEAAEEWLDRQILKERVS